MSTPNQLPSTEVNASVLLPMITPFLERYRERESEIEELRDQIDRGMRFRYGHPVLRIQREVQDIERLCKLAPDLKVRLTTEGCRTISGLTPNMVDDLVRDLRRSLEYRHSQPSPPPIPQPRKADSSEVVAGILALLIAICVAVEVGLRL